MAGWATWTRAAARVKFPSSATATTYLSCRSSISSRDRSASQLCLGLLAVPGSPSGHVHPHHRSALAAGLATPPGAHRLARRAAHVDRAPARARPRPRRGAAVGPAADHGHARRADRGLRGHAAPVPPHRPSGPGVTTMAPILPEWPARTIAVLATVDDGPHAIPVSAPVRADDHT